MSAIQPTNLSGALISIGIAILDFLPVFGTGTVLWPWAVIKVLGGDFKMAIGC